MAMGRLMGVQMGVQVRVRRGGEGGCNDVDDDDVMSMGAWVHKHFYIRFSFPCWKMSALAFFCKLMARRLG